MGGNKGDQTTTEAKPLRIRYAISSEMMRLDHGTVVARAQPDRVDFIRELLTSRHLLDDFGLCIGINSSGRESPIELVVEGPLVQNQSIRFSEMQSWCMFHAPTDLGGAQPMEEVLTLPVRYFVDFSYGRTSSARCWMTCLAGGKLIA